MWKYADVESKKEPPSYETNTIPDLPAENTGASCGHFALEIAREHTALRQILKALEDSFAVPGHCRHLALRMKLNSLSTGQPAKEVDSWAAEWIQIKRKMHRLNMKAVPFENYFLGAVGKSDPAIRLCS